MEVIKQLQIVPTESQFGNSACCWRFIYWKIINVYRLLNQKYTISTLMCADLNIDNDLLPQV